MPPQSEIEALRTLYPELSAAEEGGISYFLIENLKLPDGAEPQTVTGLLCPTERDGYPSRLFLSQQVSHKGKGQNWNPKQSVVILGRSWWSVSWMTRKGQTLVEMILDHLGAFRQ